MEGLRARVDYVLKHNTAINKSFKFLASTAVKAMGLFVPMDNKAIIFSAHSRKYNDSPRAIYEYMITLPEFKDYTFYWALDDTNVEIPGNAVKIVPDTPEYFRTALKCKYWITCVNIERSLKFKRKNCVYLNTWHGIPIKTVGNMAEGRKDYDFSHIDYFCVSGDYEIDLYEKSFNVQPAQIIKTGLPRNDVLYKTTKDEVEEIKKKLGLPLDKKLILYAPTWRDSKDGGKSYTIKPPMDLAKWEKMLGEKYILLFRTHPYTNKLLGVEFNSFVRDYVNYPNINDLMKISDILISDYSATIFDYAILERPIISFAYDCDEYGEERGFAMDPRAEMPGGIVKTEDEVIDRILGMNYEKEVAAVKAFKNKYLTYGGQATEKCVKKMFEV
jgi:CDP-glycerol glycerophosphotransferase